MEKTMPNSDSLKKMLEQDIEWMWDEGFYTLANRLDRALTYIEILEDKAKE
jgi:hypothetical protein